jgi:hypothetical protein
MRVDPNPMAEKYPMNRLLFKVSLLFSEDSDSGWFMDPPSLLKWYPMSEELFIFQGIIEIKRKETE